MTSRVLLIEDSPEFQLIVQEALSETDVAVYCASNASEAMQKLQREVFDLILLDVALPDGNGFDICKQLKKENIIEKTPVIFLTSKSEVQDKVKGFELGADDYIVKPFELNEFRARIRARLSRARRDADQKNRIAKELIRSDLKIDISQHKAFMQEGETYLDLHLTPAEFKILWYLADNEGKIFKGEELLSAIWEHKIHVVRHNIYTHIYGLRKKLKHRANYLQSLPRGGYLFNCRIQK